MRSPKVGDPAPDFELDGTAGTFRLSDHRGERDRPPLLPGRQHAVCTRQFCSYRDDAEGFDALEATVVGISTQSVDSHRDLRPSTGSTCRCWPIRRQGREGLRRAPRAGRARPGAVVIVDEQGNVGYRHDHLLGLDFQTVDDLREALDAMPGAPA